MNPNEIAALLQQAKIAVDQAAAALGGASLTPAGQTLARSYVNSLTTLSTTLSNLAAAANGLSRYLPAATGAVQVRRTSPAQYLKLTPNGGTWGAAPDGSGDTLVGGLNPGPYQIEYAPGQTVSFAVVGGQTVKVTLGTAPAPVSNPTPPPAPRPLAAKGLADLRSSADDPTRSSWLIANPAELARINSSGVDYVAVIVDGVSLEAFRPGWRFDEAAFRAQVEPLLKALTAPKLGLVFWTAAPGKPGDNAAWDACVGELGKLFSVCNGLGIKLFCYDNEPYQTVSGGRLENTNPEVAQQSRDYGVPISIEPDGRWNYWDFGIHMLYGKSPTDRNALARQFRKVVNALGRNNPGAHWYFYHDVAASDGAAPAWVNMGQAGNGFFGLAAMLVGAAEAVVSDGAEAFVGGFNEAFASDVDGDGPDIFARQLAYRKAAAPNLNGLVPMSPALLSRWATTFGFGAMRRYTDEATTNPADITKNARAIYATGLQAPLSGSGKTGTALIGAYSESGNHWPDAAWAAFRAAKP